MPIRPIVSADHEALNRLHRQVGWPERSPAGWRWLEANPARIAIAAPAGWVVADQDDQATAMLGNFVQRFRGGPHDHYGATGFSIIVPPDQRGASRPLIRAFLDQPGVFARYTFNANARSAPIYGVYGMKPWPAETHGLKLSWVTDSIVCAMGRALRALLGRTSAATAARLGEQLMNGRLFRHTPLSLPPQVAVVRDLSDGSAYGEFWRRLSQEGRLLADRGPEAMQWRMADPDLTLAPLLLAYVKDGRIVGTAMAQMTKTSLIEPPCLDIIDLVALETASEAAPALMRALIKNARAMGAAKVRLQMVTPRMLNLLGDLVSTARREGGWGHCHAVIDDPALAAAWSPTPFDGDYGVCARNTPAPKARVRRSGMSASGGRVSKA